MNQVHASQVVVATPEPLQLLDVVSRVLGLNAHRIHPPAVNDQEVQDVDGPMPGVLELLLFDRAGDRAADRVAFQNLMVGHLIGADHPIALLGQAVGVGVAPEDLLGPLLELRIQTSGPPVASPVGLQIDVVQDPADRPRADGRDDAVSDGLAGQSSLVQWVICRPSATGSRQASSTIWARWRGGNRDRAARPRGRVQEAG